MNHLWVPHTDNECQVCEKGFKKWNLHGRKWGRSSTITLDESDFGLGSIFDEKNEPVYQGKVDFKLEIPEKTRSQYICCICQDIFDDDSVRSKCKHYFCEKCITNMFEVSNRDSVQCPICYEILNRNDLEKNRCVF